MYVHSPKNIFLMYEYVGQRSKSVAIIFYHEGALRATNGKYTKQVQQCKMSEVPHKVKKCTWLA